jgi:hypothetical protein
MRHGRLITTLLAVVAVMAILPAWAAAAASPLTDDAMTDFAAGTAGNDTWAVEPGVVRLKRAGLAENFDGTALPAGFTPTLWPPGGGTTTVTGGSLSVDGARVDDGQAPPTFSAPQTLEFRASFGGDAILGPDPNQHVGFGVTFDDGPWAIFSTGDGALPTGFYARTRATAGGTPRDVAISGVNPLQAHTYRIEWSTTDVQFYVDNVLVPVPPATPAMPVTGPMHPAVSDFAAGGGKINVDWVAMGSAPSTGTFVSRVLAADDPHTVWGALTFVGGGVSFATRSGNSATPDATWSDWQPVGSAGAIQSPSGRQNIQYRATLGSAAASLDKVEIGYAIDSTPPSAAIGGVQVSGTTASVTFSSPASDVDHFECSIDASAYAACTSPKQLTGLAVGSHTASVRAVDRAANVGSPDATSFNVAAPATSGGTTTTTTQQQSSGGSSSVGTVDKTKPKVSVVAKSLKASKQGAVSFTVGCPATEQSCKITLKLKNGKKTAASKTVNVKGGKSKTVTLTLDKATKRLLAKRHSLKVSTVVTAVDAAGNKRTTTKQATLRRAAG